MIATGQPPLAVFRADADRDIGGGHITRCLALAKALAEAGWRVAFAVSTASRTAVPALAEQTCLALNGSAAAEPERMAVAWPDGCDLLVIDHYRRDDGFERACRPWAKRILVIDDAPTRDHACDLLLDQTVGRSASDYAGRVPPGCVCLMGADHILLRPGFDRWRNWTRAIPPVARHLLVTVGQADPHRLTDRVLTALASPDLAGIAARVVVGGAFPDPDALTAITPARVELRHDVTDMAGEMAWADLALTGAGGTCWEACFMTLPLITLTVADNQRTIAARLAAAGVARPLGWHADVSVAEIITTVAELAGSGPARTAMATRGRALVDGDGRTRVVAAIEMARSRS